MLPFLHNSKALLPNRILCVLNIIKFTGLQQMISNLAFLLPTKQKKTQRFVTRFVAYVLSARHYLPLREY